MQSPDDMIAWSERLADWEEARPRLRVALYTSERVATMPAALQMPSVFDGLHPVLSIDLPGSIALVHEAHLPCWQKSRKEVEAHALLNTLEEPCRLDHNVVHGVPLVGVFGEHSYVAVRAQAVDRLLPDLGSAGALVGMPSADTLVIHRVGDADVDHALMALGMTIGQFFARAARPLSRAIHWVRPGEPARFVGLGSTDVVAGVRRAATLEDEAVRALKDAVRVASDA